MAKAIACTSLESIDQRPESREGSHDPIEGLHRQLSHATHVPGFTSSLFTSLEDTVGIDGPGDLHMSHQVAGRDGTASEALRFRSPIQTDLPESLVHRARAGEARSRIVRAISPGRCQTDRA